VRRLNAASFAPDLSGFGEVGRLEIRLVAGIATLSATAAEMNVWQGHPLLTHAETGLGKRRSVQLPSCACRRRGEYTDLP
jgi:hypothetical protein